MLLVIAFADTELSVLKVEFFLCIVDGSVPDRHAFGPLLLFCDFFLTFYL
jgi:hypothetical protein